MIPCYSRSTKYFLFLLLTVSAKAQVVLHNNNETCDGPVFSAKELSHKANITWRKSPEMTKEAVDHYVHGRIVLEAVLYKTGRVTDLRVLEELPYGMTEKAVEAVRTVKFVPAELNGQAVSQRTRFEFHYNAWGCDNIAAENAEERTVEAIEVLGNRRIAEDKIMSLIRTQPGDPYRSEQVRDDLANILATGYFEKNNTCIGVEERESGGLVMFVQVQELPLITELKFEGLSGIYEADVLDRMRKEGIDLRKGRPYNPVEIRSAITVLKRLLAENGQPNVVVGVRTNETTATTVALTFVVKTAEP